MPSDHALISKKLIPARGSGKPVQFSTVDYEGLLEVTHPGKLTETMAHGIGRAKAFGGGLLLLRRP